MLEQAFKRFKEIEELKDVQHKHRAWLRDYVGKHYSIAEEGKHKIKWQTEKREYRDSIWQPSINCIKELKNRLRIEFDDKDGEGNKDKSKIEQNLKKIKNILETKGWGYIESTHGGASDYLWIEFTKNLTDKQKKSFLEWICPEGAEIDLNFASSAKVFPVLYAPHWKYSTRETPIGFFEGSQINFIDIKEELDKHKGSLKMNSLSMSDFTYETGIKNPAKVFTIENQAQRFNEIQPLFYDKNGLWWLWDNKEYKWEIVDEVDILNMVNEATGKDVITSKARTEILNALKQKGRLNMPKDAKKTWVQFKDTIVDVITGEEIKASPEYFITNPIPYELHKDRYIETPEMDRIFGEWVGKENVKLLYQILAYSLLPDYPIHRLFCFIGGGMNGKSCFLRLLTRFLGNSNVTSTELDTLLNSRFEITKLHKKLICVMGETNFSEISKTSILKKLTGQDSIGFEYKNKNPFDDTNYAKILIATNNLPTSTDKTIGFYRRWTIIDFPNQFSEEKDILSEIPEEEYQILAVKSLFILKDLLEERRFHNEGTVEDRMKKYEDRSDFLQKFIDEYIVEDPEGYITKNEFQKRFEEWCRENRHRTLANKTIANKMRDKGIEEGKKYFNWLHDGKGGDARVWLGIKWKD